MSVAELLRRVSLFTELPDEERAALAARMSKRVFAKDMILFHKGSPAQNLYLIESGAVRIFALSEMGQEITLDVYLKDECFGETALVDGNIRSAGAVALEKTVTYVLSRDDFLRCLHQYPQVARSAMALLAHRLDQTIAYAEKLAFLDARGRLAAVLLGLAAHSRSNSNRVELDLHLTQSELASWCVISRVMVNKVLGAFRDEGLIEVERHGITILDLAGLQRHVTT